MYTARSSVSTALISSHARDLEERNERIDSAVREAKQRGKGFGLFERKRKRSVSGKVVGGRLAALFVQRLKKEGL